MLASKLSGDCLCADSSLVCNWQEAPAVVSWGEGFPLKLVCRVSDLGALLFGNVFILDLTLRMYASVP